MKYKVTFRKRFNEEGQPSDDPTALVDVPDGVIEDAEFIEMLEPPSVKSNIEAMEPAESDDFLAFGSETWVYDVAEGRERDFKDALLNSEVVLDYEEIPDESLTT